MSKISPLLHLPADQIPSALLWQAEVGPEMETMLRNLSANILCTQQAISCQNCQSCILVNKNEHPDCWPILPENGTIKIDQIRALHERIFTFPQLSKNKLIIIYGAEKMNMAASNALLKILEEPPPRTYFLLQSANLFSIPATILSRCQIWKLPTSKVNLQDYLQNHPLAAALPTILGQINSLQTQQSCIPEISNLWSKYDPEALFNLLYALIAACIHLKHKNLVLPENHALQNLAHFLSLASLYNLNDTIREIIKETKLNRPFNLNISLESVLLKLCGMSEISTDPGMPH